MGKLTFRPLPGLTVATLVALMILIGLGSWQLQRRAEKHDLLDRIEARRSLPAAPVEILLPVGAYAEFRAVTALGTFLNASEAYVSEARTDGGPTRPGFRVITPFRITGGDIILVDRGWVAADRRDPATRAEGQVLEQMEIEGVLKRSAPGSAFTPPPDPATRTVYRRNATDIAAFDGLALRSTLVLEATTRVKGGPEPLPTGVNIPDNHLNYALTWFSLAVVLLVIYLVYHARQGRLGWQP